MMIKQRRSSVLKVVPLPQLQAHKVRIRKVLGPMKTTVMMMIATVEILEVLLHCLNTVIVVHQRVTQTRFGARGGAGRRLGDGDGRRCRRHVQYIVVAITITITTIIHLPYIPSKICVITILTCSAANGLPKHFHYRRCKKPGVGGTEGETEKGVVASCVVIRELV